ncbi:MAG: hypothetical protein HY562_01210 [Ignavibacteriales bacterium]|nr:hypothetical protein [Ignavibacteriales bacterium]
MKRSWSVLSTVGVFCLFLFATCKEESITEPPPPKFDITGTWSGTYSDGLGAGTLSFNLTQNDTVVTGTYSVNGGPYGDTVNAVVSQKNFQGQTIGTVGNCTYTNNFTGSFSGDSKGDSLVSTYSGFSNCRSNPWLGVCNLKKQ